MIAFVVLSLAFADPATASTQPPAPPVVAAPAAPVDPKKDPNRMVCKYETPVGTHRPIKECHTRAEWQEMSDNTHLQIQDRHGYDKDVAKGGFPSQ